MDHLWSKKSFINDFLLLNIIKKGSSKVVSIVKLSYDIMLYLLSGNSKKTHFAKLDENARSVSGIVQKVYIIG